VKTLVRWAFLFLAITGAVALTTASFDVSFGRENYWDHRGVFFLFFVTLFPRLTLLFSSVASGGVVWWLAWIFAPRILVAVLATLAYWHQNPVLVVISWLVALSGESSEKYVVVKRPNIPAYRREPFESAKWVRAESPKSD
jgi:hypothetical protein